MVEKIEYRNHLNEIFEFGKNGVYVDENELHDFVWSVSEKNNKISKFSRGVTSKVLPVIILCETSEQGIAARNRLFELAEKDVIENRHGSIIVGEYYLKCFVTASKKKEYLTRKRHMELDLTVTTDYPFWCRETHAAFPKDTGGGSGEADLDYPHAFPHDFKSAVSAKELTNYDFVPSSFRLVVYGPCTNPEVTIGGHSYRVNAEVAAGEYLTIDSVNKTITITGSSGAERNVFNKRNKTSYIFEKIPSGASAVVWNYSFSFDLILIEERSEPKWI